MSLIMRSGERGHHLVVDQPQLGVDVGDAVDLPAQSSALTSAASVIARIMWLTPTSAMSFSLATTSSGVPAMESFSPISGGVACDGAGQVACAERGQHRGQLAPG